MFNCYRKSPNCSQDGHTMISKYPHSLIQIDDPCFIDYVAVKTTKSQVFVPHTAGRYQVKKFRKALCPIVERLVGSMQFHGRNTGKKNMAMQIVKEALDIVSLVSGKNPIEVLLKAISLGGPREASARTGSGGTAKKSSVDVSPMRRINQAIYLISNGARNSSMKNFKTIAVF